MQFEIRCVGVHLSADEGRGHGEEPPSAYFPGHSGRVGGPLEMWVEYYAGQQSTSPADQISILFSSTITSEE